MCFAFMMTDEEEIASYTFQDARDLAQLNNNTAPAQEPIAGNANLIPRPRAASVASSGYDGDDEKIQEPTTKRVSADLLYPGIRAGYTLINDPSEDASGNVFSMVESMDEPWEGQIVRYGYREIEMAQEEHLDSYGDGDDEEEEENVDDEATLIDEESEEDEFNPLDFLPPGLFTDMFISITNDEELEAFYTAMGIPH